MKTLYIARHAKSDWGQAGYSDFDRPLNDKGMGDAKAMAQYLSSVDIKVDSIITSSAMRALTTANFYADEILMSGSPIKVDEIYEAEEQTMLKVIKNISNNMNAVMLVGHNPTFSLLVSMLTNKYVDMSAGSVAELKIDLDSWNEVKTNTAQLVQIITTKSIPH
jgi:phosphohistidine phosphatase